jgi:GTP pyrophosphokinase
MESSPPGAVEMERVLAAVAEYHPAPDLDLIRRAYHYALNAHEGQTRKSGEPYIHHPVAVSAVVAALKLDEASLCAALLHDTVEDTDATLEDLEEKFGEEIAALVDGVTKLGSFKFSTREEHQAENFRKMLVAMSKDIRVLLVKLADRAHNMRTLKHMKEEKRQRIARETMDIYAPLANRLGVSWLKIELEDLAFRYLHSGEYYDLVEKVDARQEEREIYTEKVREILSVQMVEQGLKCEVFGRPKHLYSIWRKMIAQKIDYEKVYDAIAFRIIVDEVHHCYEALGHIHSAWKPIPGRFKDYIALSKPNLYRSLHTAVIGPEGRRIEVQIRTWEMHEIAEEGIAAHWKYKEGVRMSLKDEQKFAWLKQLMEWQRELADPTEFLDTVKVDLFNDEVYVFTPTGDVKVFPRGATPVDFAFAIHSEVGERCQGARVGGAMVPLSHSLRNGDVVEILTSKTKRVNPDWLKFVKSSRAKTHIRAHVRKEQGARSAEIGRELLVTELRRYGISLNRFAKRDDLAEVFQGIGGRIRDIEELYVQIGYGRVRANEVTEQIIPSETITETGKPVEADENEGRISSFFRSLRKNKSSVKVDGIEDVMVRYARCCNPVPGDHVVGFVTRGRGVTVHARDCPHVAESDPARRIAVDWETNASSGHPISIRVVCTDAPGLLASITQSITNGGVNIHQAHCRSSGDESAVNIFQVEVQNLDQLQVIMRDIKRIKGVYSVERMRF